MSTPISLSAFRERQNSQQKRSCLLSIQQASNFTRSAPGPLYPRRPLEAGGQNLVLRGLGWIGITIPWMRKPRSLSHATLHQSRGTPCTTRCAARHGQSSYSTQTASQCRKRNPLSHFSTGFSKGMCRQRKYGRQLTSFVCKICLQRGRCRDRPWLPRYLNRRHFYCREE